jgi:alpha-ketoglutarate-dependent taurine dioxygenase
MVQPATSVLQTAETKTASGITNSNSLAPTGQSVYLDGFAAARQLYHENPKAFQLLATTTRSYRCIDDKEGWHVGASGPVIEAIPRWKSANDDKHLEDCYEWGPVKSIRHNDLDRLPDLPPYTPNVNDVHGNNEFYDQLHEAHEAWDNILRRDSMRLVISLKAGDCILVSNQRCMHGRYAFETSYYPRVVMGCYVGMDELLSKWRINGFRVL